jgi:hypothetical protein
MSGQVHTPERDVLHKKGPPRIQWIQSLMVARADLHTVAEEEIPVIAGNKNLGRPAYSHYTDT